MSVEWHTKRATDIYSSEQYRSANGVKMANNSNRKTMQKVWEKMRILLHSSIARWGCEAYTIPIRFQYIGHVEIGELIVKNIKCIMCCEKKRMKLKSKKESKEMCLNGCICSFIQFSPIQTLQFNNLCHSFYVYVLYSRWGRKKRLSLFSSSAILWLKELELRSNIDAENITLTLATICMRLNWKHPEGCRHFSRLMFIKQNCKYIMH